MEFIIIYVILRCWKSFLDFFLKHRQREVSNENINIQQQIQVKKQKANHALSVCLSTHKFAHLAPGSLAEWARVLSSSLNLWKGSSSTLTLAGFVSPKRKWVQPPLHLGHELDLSRQSTKSLIYL